MNETYWFYVGIMVLLAAGIGYFFGWLTERSRKKPIS